MISRHKVLQASPMQTGREERTYANALRAAPAAVLAKIRAGQPVVTAKACYTDPELVELIASSGFDAVWICLEHKRVEAAMVYALIQACRLGGADALIRLRPPRTIPMCCT